MMNDLPSSLWTRIRYFLIGRPRNLEDPSIFRQISLIAFLAWVGFGSDGLSSSCYGPEEAFRSLGGHAYLALVLAALMAVTIFIISAAYTRIIEHFPHGGGGYVVASKLIGRHAGVVSGSALLIDYVLTIAISVAAAGDAIFSLLPMEWHVWKLPVKLFFIALLTTLNLRGVRESILALTPVFLLFVLTHIVLIVGGIAAHAGQLPETLGSVGADFSRGISTIGVGGMFLVLIHAYSLGGGTYTGIEAVSNGLAVMREPRVETGRRTMLYMAISLSFTASGLLVLYLLWDIAPVEGKTMNAVLAEKFASAVPLGAAFVVLTLLSEGALLVVAAQSGFVDGPRVLANMAVDSWVPRRFAALSDRLTAQNGVLLMSAASIAVLLYTGGDVGHLVVMYSINVFVTFLLSMLGMLRHAIRDTSSGRRARDIGLFAVGAGLCATILTATVLEKFGHGGWVTLTITGSVIALCLVIRRHYGKVTGKLDDLYRQLVHTPRVTDAPPANPDPAKPVALVLVSRYGGLGLHTFMSVFRGFPNYFKGVVFLSVGIVDSKEFKGRGTVEALEAGIEADLKAYVDFAAGQGIPATSRFAIGTDAVEEAEKLCLETAAGFPRATFFAGKIIFGKEHWYQLLLHNETAMAIQKRLQWAGKVVVVVPARVA